MSTLAVYGGVTRLFLNGLIYSGDIANRPTTLGKAPAFAFDLLSFHRNILGFVCEFVSSYQASFPHLPHNSDKASEKP